MQKVPELHPEEKKPGITPGLRKRSKLTKNQKPLARLVSFKGFDNMGVSVLKVCRENGGKTGPTVKRVREKRRLWAQGEASFCH